MSRKIDWIEIIRIVMCYNCSYTSYSGMDLFTQHKQHLFIDIYILCIVACSPYFSSNNSTLYFRFKCSSNLRKNLPGGIFLWLCVGGCAIDMVYSHTNCQIYIEKHSKPIFRRLPTVQAVFGMTFFSICYSAFSWPNRLFFPSSSFQIGVFPLTLFVTIVCS